MWIVLWNVFLALIWLIFVGEIIMCLGVIGASILGVDSPMDPSDPLIGGESRRYAKTGKQRVMEALGSIWVGFVSGVIVYFITIHFFPIVVTICAPVFKLY